MAKYEDEPTPRFWHQAFQHNEQVYVRGGQTDDLESQRDTLETTLKCFDPVREVWRAGVKTEGIPHPGLTQVACVCIDGTLYLYGTHERKVLSQLNLQTLVWSQLWETTERDDGKTPMIKTAAGMVPFSGGHLALFAGYAFPSDLQNLQLQPGSVWTPNPYERSKGWTNEFHLFNISKKMWITPTIRGTRPPPCSDFSLNRVTLNRAVLFGGYQHNLSQEELYIIDFDTVKMEIEFTKIEQQRVWPPGRECHIACCLGLKTEHPQLLVSGGKNFRDMPLKFDLWMLDLTEFVWKKIKLPAGGKRSPRYGHSMTTVVMCPGLEAVVIFGGSHGEFTGAWQSPGFPKLTETIIYSFGNHGQEWVLLEEETCGNLLSPAVLEWEKFEFTYLLSMKAIFLLEKNYGVPLLNGIAKKQEMFQRAIRYGGPQKLKGGILPSIWWWLRSDSEVKPTWENLFRILHDINLGPLAWQMVDCLLKAMIDTATKLESELSTHCYEVLGEDNILGHEIQSFMDHSNATIIGLKKKYDQLKIDNDELLKYSMSRGPSDVAVAECRREMSSTTGKYKETIVKVEPKTEGEIKIEPIKPDPESKTTIKPAQLTSSIDEVERNGKDEYPDWTDPSEIKIQQLKKDNQVLRGRLEKLEWQLAERYNKTELNSQPIEKKFELRGVDMCGQTTFVITNYAEKFVWEKYGLKLDIRENSLPKGVEKCTVSIGASIAGLYQFPENFHLVSAIFWFRSEPVCKFIKSITMEMEHCAKLENSAKLSFMRAKCTQEKLPYMLEKIGGGHFTSDRYFGSVELYGFSGVGIAQEEAQTKHQDSSPSSSPEREYGARVYCIYKNVISFRFDFVVTWNTTAHLTAIEQEYEKMHAQIDCEQIVEIESNKVALDVPYDGITTQEGWKISPLGPPVILKRHVDSYELGKIIPKCQFSANIPLQEGDGAFGIPALQQRVKLIGTKSPYNFLTLNIDPDFPGSEHPHSVKRSFSEPGNANAPSAKKRKISEPAQISHTLAIDAQISGTSSTYDTEEQSSELNIQKLMVFKWKNQHGKVERFRVVSEIFNKWQEIGIMVGIPHQQLDAWEREKRESKACCIAVLNHWLQYASPASWDGLCEILEDCELGQVAERLRVAVNAAV